ncbi:ATP-binding protein [Blautia sp. An46]|uniref:ATP-binding protein n=1 Tax=Blautia sp. An46 TaxID=1965636 RepID=UPI0013A601AA|nr:SbcC/MukB-like Walker B domain-containing protein [Blautia sp. An46]
MKKLKRMKLINWHRFENCVIDFGETTLLSGENGAGKTTILDAIQFVVICSANFFNKAAHDNGKRSLSGYVRCKTGRENKPYERTGEISAHVALEFYEESRDRYFIVGAVIDSATEGQETAVRYLMDNCRLSEEMFFKGKTPRSISEFRSFNSKGIRQWCKTQSEARKMIKARLGRIEDKFFSLIPKAMAFKPIDDIKEFVYTYVLDAKEVNIDLLRENVRSYQDLERTLESVKRRMEKLEQIEGFYEEAQDCVKRDGMYEFFLSQAEVDLIKERIQRLEEEIQAEEYRKKQLTSQLEETEKERAQKQEIETNLRVELRQNQDFIALEEQKKELERFLEEEKNCLEEKRILKKSIKKSLDQMDKLLEIKDVDPCVRECRKRLESIEEIQNVPEARALLDQVIQYKNQMYGKVQRKLAEVQIRLRERQTEREQLEGEIQRLKRKKLSYPEAVERLTEAVREEFQRLGRKAEPHVLCEVLEIADESWRNAVEGYLNTQRFYILVEPENFDIALGIYDRLRREKKAYGAGLINTQHMEDFDEAPEGTLAQTVTSKNKYARRYINMVLGKVKMCQRYEDLKKYSTSITRECMRYQNKVASAIKPEIFRVPFIGKNAFKVQLEQAEKKREVLNEELEMLQEKIKNLEFAADPLLTGEDVDVKYRLEILTRLSQVKALIQKCRENIKTLEKNSTLIEKQIQLEVLEKIRTEIEKKAGDLNRQIGIAEQKIENRKEQLQAGIQEKLKFQAHTADLTQKAGDRVLNWKKEYEKQTSQKTFQQFKENYEKQRKSNWTRKENSEAFMTEQMVQYKSEYNFGAPASMKGYPEFAAVYDRLRTSELLDYEEKVEAAKQAAEEEFREQFLAKLQENMKQAQGEFKELNRALKDIAFSSEQYEFLYMPSKKYRSYYEMLMDDFNVVQGESIFSGIFHENHREVIDELFERLAIQNDNNSKTLDEFTDYRTYMDYDIKIIHSDGSYSYYSKVCEEKSGGETQTPFYVTVAASFVQLYSNNIGGEAAGLVMFDEAFNNMDDERIGGVLEFLKRLPLQILIAAPPDKIQYIGPQMEETLLIMTDEKVSYVEEYYNGRV